MVHCASNDENNFLCRFRILYYLHSTLIAFYAYRKIVYQHSDNSIYGFILRVLITFIEVIVPASEN